MGAVDVEAVVAVAWGCVQAMPTGAPPQTPPWIPQRQITDMVKASSNIGRLNVRISQIEKR